MSKHNLTDTLVALKASSPTAAAIIDKHYSGFVALAADDKDALPDAKESNEMVRSLLDLVAYQNEVIDTLSNKQEKTSLTIEEEAKQFAQRISGSYVSDLIAQYDKVMLLTLKPETRLVICRELINYAYTKNKEPAALWKGIVATNGALEK